MNQHGTAMISTPSRRRSFYAVGRRSAASEILTTALRTNGIIRPVVPINTEWIETQLTDAEMSAVLETLDQLDPQSVVICC